MSRTPPADLGADALARPLRVDAHPAGAAALADPALYAAGAVPPARWFESVYADAAGEAGAIPWARGRPNPHMVNWLNTEAPGLVRPGARAIVVGCGLGDDVAEFACRGYDATGFDLSPTAIQWARRRFLDLTSGFMVADLLELPPRFRHRFDLVIETYTIQALPPALRRAAAGAVGSLCTQRGVVLTIARGRDRTVTLDDVVGPPWPLTVAELTDLMDESGLRPLGPAADFLDDENPPVRRLRAAFSR